VTTDRIDVLIIGQGLAGSLLAHALLARGRRVRVVDDGHASCATTVAAGIVNPLAGIRFNAAPGTLDWLDAAEACYDALGRRYGQRYFHRLPMLRVFRSPEQARFFERRLVDGDDPFTAGRLDPTEMPPFVHAPFGGFVQTRTGYVDLVPLIAASKAEFTSIDAYRERTFVPDDLVVEAKGVRYAGTVAEHAVYCTGARLETLPWFADLPLAPTKGEILEVGITPRPTETIVNGAHWLVPIEDGRYRFGATHTHTFEDATPTGAARAELEAGLAHLVRRNVSSTVTGHTAGIRPGTRDRQPLVGTHPKHASLHVFSGFGGRGCLKVPWYAERFADYLAGAGDLPVEADIRRFDAK